VVRRLVATDHQVTCLVRATSDTSALSGLGLALTAGDVTDGELGVSYTPIETVVGEMIESFRR